MKYYRRGLYAGFTVLIHLKGQFLIYNIIKVQLVRFLLRLFFDVFNDGYLSAAIFWYKIITLSL